MGSRLDWSTGSTGLRRGIVDETRYAFARSLDRRAVWIAAAAPLLATIMVLSTL